MIKILKKYIKQTLFRKGYKVSKINNKPLQSDNPFFACKSEILTTEPIIFDVGMNHGQTLLKIKEIFPASVIHGFEASKYCFKDLYLKFGSQKSIVLNHLAIGEQEDVLQFNEYS